MNTAVASLLECLFVAFVSFMAAIFCVATKKDAVACGSTKRTEEEPKE